MIVIRGSFIPSRGKWVKKDILIKDGRIQKISKEINEKDLNGAEVIEGSGSIEGWSFHDNGHAK